MPATQRLHVERLLGRKVYDPAGRCAGRIEDLKAETTRDGRCLVTEYHLGRRALFARLSVTDLALSVLRLFGADKFPTTHRVPWRYMDLSDPDHPKLTCAIDELWTA